MDYTVYYWKDPSTMTTVFLDGIKPTPQNLETTHTKLGTFSAKDKEDLFRNLQAESMPPEIYKRVRVKAPSHTSMSVGDVVQEGNNFFQADICGFARIT